MRVLLRIMYDLVMKFFTTTYIITVYNDDNCNCYKSTQGVVIANQSII